jgi:hypothetical protein
MSAKLKPRAVMATLDHRIFCEANAPNLVLSVFDDSRFVGQVIFDHVIEPSKQSSIQYANVICCSDDKAI